MFHSNIVKITEILNRWNWNFSKHFKPSEKNKTFCAQVVMTKGFALNLTWQKFAYLLILWVKMSKAEWCYACVKRSLDPDQMGLHCLQLTSSYVYDK